MNLNIEFGADRRNHYLVNKTAGFEYLKEIYPLFVKRYNWFRRTQWGHLQDWGRDSSKEGYRWRGRSGHHTLTSGLDDYPRSPEPHIGELHLDLICWIGHMAKSLTQLATTLGYESDAIEFKKQLDDILTSIDQLHWDETAKVYTDLTIENDESVHVVHKGYVSLFPLLLGLLDHKSPKLGATLDLIRDPNQLWSEYGICSLSKSDSYFGTGENYWRGPIWMNVNYLVLSSLHNVSLVTD
jgi:mannosyl-oligosaccharide glucosidase